MSLSLSLTDLFKSDRMHHSWIVHSNDTDRSLREIKAFAQNVFSSDLPIDNNPDLYIVRRAERNEDVTKHILVEQIRNVAVFLSTKTLKPRILVILDADMMNANASNCCLKLLEEPGANNYIFLIVNNPNKILPTIRSRCAKISDYMKDDDDTQHKNLIDDLMLYSSDHKALIAKLTSKIEKDFVLNLCERAIRYLIEKQIYHGDTQALHKMEHVRKISSDLMLFDIDPRVSLILLISTIA